MIYRNFTTFLKNRTIELVGLCLIFVALLLGLSFFSYSPNDPTLVYGAENANINNLLGVYGGIVSDFLLQSFGLTSFLILITAISWGINLMFKKRLQKIKYKIFYLFLYIIFASIFIYTTYNNSFWLIDNGNSGFVGQILYDKILTILPFVNHDYTSFLFLVLAVIFFILSSDIRFNKFFSDSHNLFSFIKKRSNSENDLGTIYNQSDLLDSQVSNAQTNQQVFSFDKTPNIIEPSPVRNQTFKNFRLPPLHLLEKNSSKINLLDLSKNRPEGSFIEKILLDFGIDGKITKINNGPVVRTLS